MKLLQLGETCSTAIDPRCSSLKRSLSEDTLPTLPLGGTVAQLDPLEDRSSHQEHLPGAEGVGELSIFTFQVRMSVLVSVSFFTKIREKA